MSAARLGLVFRAVVVGQLGNEQIQPPQSISEAPFFTREKCWGLFLEVREQNPQVSLVYLPSISPCSELYSSRAFHAVSSCTSEDTTGGPGESSPTVLGVSGSLGWVSESLGWVSGAQSAPRGDKDGVREE